MKIIELNETQFRNYSKLHSSRNYFQTIEYSKTKTDYKNLLLGFINEENDTLMGAALILEKKFGSFKLGQVPGGFLIDYNNDNLFKDFINTLKNYLKKQKYIYLTIENISPYKMYDKSGEVIYFDTNIIKLLDELSFVKIVKERPRKVVLETEKTPEETYQNFNSNTKRNINLALQRAITIYKDENNNVKTLLNLDNSKKDYITALINNFNTNDNKAEIYFAKINFENYINNYRFLQKEENKNNDILNTLMQDFNTKKTISLITKKMKSDKLLLKYNNEIIKATNAYTKYPEEVIIGAMLIIKNNREIYFVEETHNKDLEKYYSSHLIKWEIIKKYLIEGYKIFNFGNINNINKKNGNQTFKMGFGGKIYECIGTYDLIINKWLYKPIKLINKIKSISKVTLTNKKKK